MASLCEHTMQRALSRWEDSACIDTGEGRVADMLEEAKLAVQCRVAVVQFGPVQRPYLPDPKPTRVRFGALAQTPNLIWGLVQFRSELDILPCQTRSEPKPPIQGTHVMCHMTHDTFLFLRTPHQHFLTHIHLLSLQPYSLLPPPPPLSNSPYKLCPQW